MKITQALYQRFNQPDTLIVVSSFPLRGEEIAKRNAVSRYSDLLLSHFPEDQKVLVLCERVAGQDNRPYLLSKNILVLPAFLTNSYSLFIDLAKQLQKFSAIKNILLQFEFSLFGKEVITFLLPLFFLLQRFAGKKITIMLHQVVLDLSTLAGQVQLPAHALKTQVFNLAMKLFYATFGLACQKVLVHDQFLAEKLAGLVPRQKIRIIPHGINGYQHFSATQQAKIKQTLGLKKSDRVLLAYGYHSWYKGTDWIIKNFLRLKAEQKIAKNVKLVLAGDVAPTQKEQAHLRRYYRALSSSIAANSASILHTGFVPEKDVAKIFAIADFCVFPYRSRMSSSGALALALQYHKPFICSAAFAENLQTDALKSLAAQLQLNLADLSFRLRYDSFVAVFQKAWNNKSLQAKLAIFGRQVARQQSWQAVGQSYLQVLNVPKKKSVFALLKRLRFDATRKILYFEAGA